MLPSVGKFWRSSSTNAWVEPESNQTSRMSSTFCQPSAASFGPRKRQRAPAQRVAIRLIGDRLVHGDEPLRRVAEDHRPLRAPRMRVLVLQPAACEQHAGLDQRLDDGFVGVALLALVGDDAFARKTRR